MKFSQSGAEIYVPDGSTPDVALARTTHLAVGAHPDDLEIMALHGILTGLRAPESFFSGVVVTDGGASPRAGGFEVFDDAQIREIRRVEQKKAADLGCYSAVVLQDYSSEAVKAQSAEQVVDELAQLVAATGPTVLYTHNPMDKHDTHVAVCLRVIAACRHLPPDQRPTQVLGCEVWRGLDWLVPQDQLLLDLSAEESMGDKLLAAFESQIAGGKRYDLGAQGRRRANAVFNQSHQVGQASSLSLAVDLTSLIADPAASVRSFAAARLDRFAKDVHERLGRLDTSM